MEDQNQGESPQSTEPKKPLEQPVVSEDNQGESKQAEPKRKLRGISELFSDTMSVFSKGAKPMILVALIILAVNVGLTILAFSGLFTSMFAAGAFPEVMGLIGFVIIGLFAVIFVIASVIMQIWGQATFIEMSREIDEGRVPEKFTNAMKSAWKFFWPLLGLTILVGLITVAGLIVLIVPGVILGMMLMFASYALVLEGKSVTDSMRRSFDLVKGNFWPVLGRALLFALIILAINSVIGFIPIIGQLITAVIYAIIAPVSAIYYYLIYKDLSK